MFISTLTENQAIAAIISYAILQFLYLIKAYVSLIPESAGVSFGIILVLTAVLGVIVGVMTKNYIFGTIVGVVLALAEIILFFVKSTLFENIVPKALLKLGIFDQMTNFIYGVFDLKAITYYLGTVIFFGFLTVLAFDKKRWN